MSIENTNRWRQCTLKIDNPVEIFVRTPIQPIEQQAACRLEGNDGDDDDHNYDHMIYGDGDENSYLIFVIFFTLAKFLENKIYTKKTRKLRQNTQ